jgi:hypothetical protein
VRPLIKIEKEGRAMRGIYNVTIYSGDIRKIEDAYK